MIKGFLPAVAVPPRKAFPVDGKACASCIGRCPGNKIQDRTRHFLRYSDTTERYHRPNSLHDIEILNDGAGDTRILETGQTIFSCFSRM